MQNYNKTHVLEYLKRASMAFPSNNALSCSLESFSYAQVVFSAKRIADYIKSHSQALESSPIPICMEKSSWAVVAKLGILMSGNFYCPLDPKSPMERIEKINKKLNPSIFIVDNTTLSTVESIDYNGSLLNVNDVCDQPVAEGDLVETWRDISYHISHITDIDPCYVIFTSGSTGVPKGVTITHRGVIDYIDWANNTYSIDSSDKIANQAPFYFDNSTLDIYLSLSNGSELYIVPEINYVFPIKLVDYLVDNKITVVFWVPSVLVNIANAKLLHEDLNLSLKYVLFAGEVMPAKHMMYWLKNLPGAKYSNLYGPTEITVDCTYYNVPKDWHGDDLPIGLACKNSGILVLDESDNPSEYGELCVRGSGLSLGYWNDEEKTKEVFVQNPLHNNYTDIIYRTGDIVRLSDGLIYYVGRKDFQIKYNGYRIELGEIESAYLGHSDIHNACCTFDVQKKEICLHYISESIIDVHELRLFALERLPKYMVPKNFKVYNEFPMTPNGKVDRKAMAV